MSANHRQERAGPSSQSMATSSSRALVQPTAKQTVVRKARCSLGVTSKAATLVTTTMPPHASPLSARTAISSEVSAHA
eukprot:1358399-Prymnesium_polylepis.1